MSLAAKVRGKAKIWFTNGSGEEEVAVPRTDEVVVRSMDDDEKETESLWMELKEFSKAHILECSTFAIFVIFCIYCIFNAFGFVGTNALKLRSEYYKNAVINHCQFPENDVLHGSEGLTDHPNATLISILAVVRHGDRYGIQRVETGDCQVLNDQEEKWFDEYVSVAQKQNLPSLLKMSPGMDNLKKLPERKVCGSRTLTPRGAIQVFQIGRYLSGKYKNTRLFNTSEKSINLTITASQKQRTVASGVALACGLLDQNHTKFMAPIAFKGGKLYYGCTDPGCDCDVNFEKMDTLVRKEREGMFRLEATEKMRKMTEFITSNKTIDNPTDDPNQILDFLVAEHSCQRYPLPCGHENCVSYLFIGDLIEFCKSQSTRRFDLDMGIERQYRVTSAYPIMRTLGLLMERDQKEVQLFASHDTVISSILRVLTNDGSHTDLQVYGARIMFEVYEISKKTRMFRVVYNGDDITSSLTFCKNLLDHGLCPAAEFKKFVAKGIFEIASFESFEQTCNFNF